jgi:hypothetical protein
VIERAYDFLPATIKFDEQAERAPSTQLAGATALIHRKLQ